MKTYKVRNDKGETFEVDAEKIGDAEKDGYLPVVSNGKEEHRVASSDLHTAQSDGYRPLGDKGALQATSDFIDSASENMSDMLPGKGLITKAASLVPSAVEYGYDRIAKDGQPRSFSDTYDENLKEGLDYQNQRREASTAGKVVGTGMGLVTGMKLPGIGNSPVTRVAGNAALSAADEGTRGQDLFDEERALKAAGLTGSLSAGLEAVPYVGKALGYAGKKAGSVLFGVGEEATEKYLTNPEKMRDLIEEGPDGLRRVKDEVDQAYDSRVTSVRDSAAERLLDAKEARKEAARAAEDHIAGLKNVKPHEALTDEVIKGVRNENSKLTKLSSEAYDTLDGSEFDRSEIMNKINQVRGGLLVDGKRPTLGDSAPAWGVLDRLEAAVKSNKPVDTNSIMNAVEEVPGIAGKDLKRLVQQLDQESSAAYTTYGSRGAAKHIKSVRDEIDPILKSNEKYAQAMVPTADQARLVSQLTKVFGNPEKARRALLLSADPEKGESIRTLVKSLDSSNGTSISKGLDEYVNAQKILRDPETRLSAKRMMMNESERGLSDAQKAAKEAGELRSQYSRVGPNSSENTIKSVGREKNIEGEKQLRALLGDEGLEKIKDLNTAQSFSRETMNGARRTGAGAIVGAMFGGPIGATVGAAAGATVDKLGGKIWQKVLDGTLKAGPYAKVLEAAAKRGPAAVGATHLILMKSHPAYKKSVEDSEK